MKEEELREVRNEVWERKRTRRAKESPRSRIYIYIYIYNILKPKKWKEGKIVVK